MLYAQLEGRETIQANRQRRWERYDCELRDWAAHHNVRLPIIPAECEQPYHMFYVLLPTLEMRQALINHLKSRGILAVFHYQPLNRSAMGAQYGGDCPVTERIADQLLRLPLYNDFTEDEQSQVLDALDDFAD